MVTSIILFVEDNVDSNDIRFSHIEEVYTLDGIHARHGSQYNNNNTVARGGGEWSQTTHYHCTNPGNCDTDGTCDNCSKCKTIVTNYYPNFTSQGDNGDDNGGGADGGAYNGGGGGAGSYYDPNDTNNDDEQDNKCEKLKALTLTDSTSANILPVVNSLRTKLNLDKEWSINYKKQTFNGELHSVPQSQGIEEGVSNTRSTFKFGNIWFGQIHTHPEGFFKIFSWLDLKAIQTIYNNVHQNFKDDVFVMVVAPNDEVYALKVNNITRLGLKLQTDLNNAKGNTQQEKEDNIEDKMIKKYTKNENDLEKAFLELYGSHGVNLYKATDANLTNWKLLELDNTDDGTEENTVKETPCN